jgi:hypothetical protein
MENKKISLNNNILIHLIEIKSKLFFKFWLRRRNTNERLDNGYWFNGI